MTKSPVKASVAATRAALYSNAMNLYDWQSHHPHIGIPRQAVDYREAQRQVESYWTAEVAAGTVVQLTDAEIADWPERYRQECLESLSVAIERLSTSEFLVSARFSCQATTADGMTAHVEHSLLRLSRYVSSESSRAAPTSQV
jgi:hypothetical protein